MTSSTLPGWWTRFVHRYGWRAYAVPVLAIVTVVVLVRPTAGASTVPAAAAAPVVAADAEQLSAPQTLPPTTPAADLAACAGNTETQLIVVHIAEQHAWACNGATLALSTPVTTGADQPDRETQVGSWRIQAKQADRTLTGPGYAEHVDYWMPYNGDFGLHDALFQTFAFGSAQWKTDGSHGCVHFPLDAMAWVYQWAAVGTEVTITA